MQEAIEKMGEVGLVPVIAIHNADDAVLMAKALLAGDLPIAEITFRTKAAEEAIERIAAAVCGGITEWLKIADLAKEHNIPIAPHWFADLHIHLVAAVNNALFVEFFPDTSILNFMRLLKKSVEAGDGELILAQEPGLGIEFKEDVIEKYSVDGWENTYSTKKCGEYPSASYEEVLQCP